MKIGDLVRYKTHNGEWGHFVGVVVRQVSGTDEIQVIRWPLGPTVVIPEDNWRL